MNTNQSMQTIKLEHDNIKLKAENIHLKFCYDMVKKTNQVIALNLEMQDRQIRDKDTELSVLRMRNSN